MTSLVRFESCTDASLGVQKKVQAEQHTLLLQMQAAGNGASGSP